MFSSGFDRFGRVGADQARDVETVAGVVFAESDVDLLVAQPLPPTDLYRHGLFSWEKCTAMAETYSDRFVFRGVRRPMEGDRALELMERQLGAFGAEAFKLYNVRYDCGEPFPWRMDDPRVAFPGFEKARELGVDLIGVHKGVPLGPQPIEGTELSDIDRAAAELSDLTSRCSTRDAVPRRTPLAGRPVRRRVRVARGDGRLHRCRPRKFAETIGKLSFRGGPGKLVYGPEMPLFHLDGPESGSGSSRCPRTSSRATAIPDSRPR